MSPSVPEKSDSSNHLLKADALRADPRIAEARRLIAETVADHAQDLTAARPAEPTLISEYEAMLERLGQARGGTPFWPYLAAGLGNGPFV